MDIVFNKTLNRRVASDGYVKTLTAGALQVDLIAYPEMLVTPDDAGDLIREQVAALREFADMFEAQLPKMQNMETVK